MPKLDSQNPVKSSRRLSAAVQNPLETYLREINETALLNADQEKELAHRIAVGEKEARDRMVRANLRLVVNIARSYTGKGLPLPDLIEEGNLGLLRAVEGFDPTMNTRFSTYASYWIKQSIKRALINSAKTIRIPAYMVELLSKWRRANARLTEELGRSPTPEEIARVLGLPKKKLPIIKKAIKIYNATPQTDQSEAGWTLSDMVMDEGQITPEDAMMESDSLHHVMGMLATMDQREATVLRMRFGLDDHEPRTLKEIGESLASPASACARSKPRPSASWLRACRARRASALAWRDRSSNGFQGGCPGLSCVEFSSVLASTPTT
jgi:RNA polymerase primary sigma factor